jgi:hypothetical protein
MKTVGADTLQYCTVADIWGWTRMSDTVKYYRGSLSENCFLMLKWKATALPILSEFIMHDLINLAHHLVYHTIFYKIKIKSVGVFTNR